MPATTSFQRIVSFPVEPHRAALGRGGRDSQNKPHCSNSRNTRARELEKLIPLSANGDVPIRKNVPDLPRVAVMPVLQAPEKARQGDTGHGTRDKRQGKRSKLRN